MIFRKLLYRGANDLYVFSPTFASTVISPCPASGALAEALQSRYLLDAYAVVAQVARWVRGREAQSMSSRL
jgi:hypothetical protein